MSISSRFFDTVDVYRKVLDDQTMTELLVIVFADLKCNIYNDDGVLAERYGQDMAEYMYGMSTFEKDIIENDIVVLGNEEYTVIRVDEIRGKKGFLHHVDIDLKFMKIRTPAIHGSS